MVNAAIVGAGRWGQILVESVQGESDNIRFTAGVTGTRAKAEEFCAKHDIDLRDDYADILNDPAIDGRRRFHVGGLGFSPHVPALSRLTTMSYHGLLSRVLASST